MMKVFQLNEQHKDNHVKYHRNCHLSNQYDEDLVEMMQSTIAKKIDKLNV